MRAIYFTASSWKASKPCEIEDDLVIKAATSIMGARGRGASKARDPKKMSEAGKKGGWPKGRPRRKHVKPSLLS